MGAIDSAATDHFMPATYTGCCNPQPFTDSITVGCANGTHMQATATDVLAIPQLPTAARSCHKFKDMHIPLISVPKLCQAGCKVNFSKDKVDVTSSSGEHLHLTGLRDITRNLYTVPIPNNTT
eukprot:CAMPEP_0168164686 /NCGR_PEP_ID=MMETSP0139_2-20121125/1074_1 /TAXON_ID=44445 /ORGANISM="Pseudo-nitzschia australis, Strain 10249 10 AB" /LENGTH=122 /DNA_ID=CAMNT_0008081729 /DNA_START=152 /DNA_END=517 /DNA_ORIENTATION=-